jgi:nitrogen regulatory protein PII
MKMIVAYIKPFKLETVKDELRGAGFHGMSVSEIRGFGRQAGQKEVYRGAEYEVEFVPKVRIEVLVDDTQATEAVSLIENAAHTGEIGDGKIAILAAEEVVRIRTGERGSDAL